MSRTGRLGRVLHRTACRALPTIPALNFSLPQMAPSDAADEQELALALALAAPSL